MPSSSEDCGVKSLMLKSRLKSILGTVYLTCWGWFGAGAPRRQGFAGLLLEGLDEFGTAERASGSIVDSRDMRNGRGKPYVYRFRRRSGKPPAVPYQVATAMRVL
jgi:hypothetical protein